MLRHLARVALAACCVIALCSSPTPAAPAFGQLQPWDTGASFPGGKQADVRLDKPVHFWRAALTLEEVFQGIEQQTGVKVGFFPADDQNRRVRVHLFLNKEQPPALREVMVQLAWVVDCPFFTTTEGGERSYYLMSTSVGTGAEGELRARKEATQSANQMTWKKIEKKLDEYQAALSLDRAALIAKYRGNDDFLLLNLLDPARRAAVSFACRHREDIPQPEMEYGVREVLGGVEMAIDSSHLKEGDRADLQTAFGFSGALLSDEQTAILLDFELEGYLQIDPRSPLIQDANGRPKDSRWAPLRIVDVADDFVLSPKDELTLHRLLGDDIPPAREQAALQEFAQAAAVLKKQKQETTLAAERSLSPRMTDRLRGLSVPVHGVDHYLGVAPWTAEEAVAKASGLNVVSDGLLWTRRYPWPPPNATEDMTMSALDLLDSFTHAPAHGTLSKPSWEWGDAGSFLRFRTRDRAIWRGAMLPPEFLDWIDSLIQPHLPGTFQRGRPVTDIAIPLDLKPAVRMLGRLTPLQIGFGDFVCSGDPMDPRTVARRSALSALFDRIMMSGESPIRFLASLNDAQWKQLAGDGLRYDRDLSPDQQALLTAKQGGSWMILSHLDLPHAVLKLESPPPSAQPATWGALYPARGYRLVFSLPEEERYGQKIPAYNTPLDVLPRVLPAHVWAPKEAGR